MKDRLPAIWQAALENLSTRLHKTSYEIWLEKTRPVTLYENTLIVTAVDEFTRSWVERNYSDQLRASLREVSGLDLQLKFVIPQAVDENEVVPTPPPYVEEKPVEETGSSAFLNPKYTFDTFVIGAGNRFAHAASLAVAEAPARAYNPLFIYGGVGLGKTHLMHAIGHFVMQQNPAAKVVYVTFEKFLNDFIQSIQKTKTNEFRNRYRNVDILLVDDIQFISGAEKTQEEFFHTFNHLHSSSKQIIISSDRPPKEIPTLEDRLRSRFEWGLITDIQPPDYETRIAILRRKAVTERLSVPDDVFFYIANKVNSNIRELEGALIRVVAYANLNNFKISVDLANTVLKDLFPDAKTRIITIDHIQQVVARFFDLKVDDLKAKKRTQQVAFPRQIAMYLSRELTDNSLPKIGESFGGRDHTTVLHANDKITKAIANNPSTDNMIKELIKLIQG